MVDPEKNFLFLNHNLLLRNRKFSFTGLLLFMKRERNFTSQHLLRDSLIKQFSRLTVRECA
jgi:hypothetical protein